MANALQINTWVNFETVDCYKCGVTFAVSAALRGNWLRDKTEFFCPNGHSQSYLESTAQRLQRELDAAKRDAEWQKQRAETAAKRAEKAERATTRLQKRVNCGVCPHCQRTFKQMAAHIKSKHPEVLASK